ncbi:3-oxoadipate enol-lactonase [Cupriavidus basilensis]|uniref:3-oxoadipate enol-lactonase n=1 Tax=Cupriavidus basilensis TaxID=68895 RepID=A0ABT6AWD1_9BURK|nr:3-oxoadipate enol-lactonase [Cupriavidus basilensis]MDF3836784.1 3-oxoadipate enol-lactonase [Cupriavidus basilensis]
MTTAFHQGAALHYRIEGAADAPVLVLSNSLGTDLQMWAPQMDSLLTRFRVLRYDTRGHGGSSLPGSAEPFGFAELGRDVLAIMDHAGIGRAHFCGLSMGGMTGIWLAAHHPERFDRFVLANTAALIGPASGWDTRIQTVRAQGMAAIVDAVLARWFSAGWLAANAARIAPVRQMLLDATPAGYTANCAAVRDADLRPLLPRIASQVLVIAGTHDLATTPAQGREVADGVAGARYVELDGAHLSNWEQPQAFADAVCGFLAG